ncbi:hypothetical protein Nepgr_008649 [Nepenthes gracilis]|uniref:Pentatricopeptide repeat-containing protein n=1 Tax=Nepenthes gracilis TaxID=150966 RepID=A0AAD3XJH1_NEPGR|nr:hypothetical protein Nepgr_008649 [Nepenthes gracilis]
MQALGIWPPKGDFLRVPQVEFHLGFPCFRCKRKRRKRRLYHCNVVDNRCPGPSLVWSNLRDAKHGMKIRCFAGSSRLDISLFSDAKRCSYGLFIALAMALEDQEIENHFGTEDSERIPELSNEVEDEDVQCLNPFHENGNFDDERGVDIRSAEELDEDKIMRVDVRGLAHSLQSAKSVEDIEEVLKDKDGLPLKVYSSMIRGFGREKKLEPAMALVEWLKKKGRESEGFHGPNLFIYNSLLGAVKHSERFEQVEGIMSDMVQNGITPDVVTCNTLMAIHLEQQRPAEALSVLHDVQNKGLSPSPASYSTALLAYRRMEDGSGALKLFVEVKEKYMKGDLGKCGDNDWKGELVKLKNFTSRICYQVMRRWLVNDQNMSIDVLKLLIDMDKVELPPSQAELERLIWACTREEHYPVAKELYNRIRERHSEVSLSVCNHIIWLMGKSKKWWAALEIYEDLLDKGPRPNNLSYELIISHFNILLTAARRRGIWRWGVRLLNKMEGKGLRPGTREWNAVLVACSKASETTAAVQIFRRMVEKGEKPTIISYGALLSALEKGKLYDEAIRVWEHMIKVGIEPNLHAYTIMASIYVALGRLDVVDSIIREMVSTGNKPTVVTFNAIITGCARNGMESTAYEWFHRMKVLNISPNEITYEMLIEALAKDGKPKLAYDLYLRAHNEGLHLSRRAYDAVIQSSETFGATIDAALLGPRPVEKKNKVRIRKNLSEFCDLAGVPRRSKPFDREEIYAQYSGEDS